jgi:hypothetical protein
LETKLLSDLRELGRAAGQLVAGKPISTTHCAQGSTPVPGTSLATGQAAGGAASVALCDGFGTHKVVCLICS